MFEREEGDRLAKGLCEKAAKKRELERDELMKRVCVAVWAERTRRNRVEQAALRTKQTQT